jgi:hypothetical protein
MVLFNFHYPLYYTFLQFENEGRINYWRLFIYIVPNFRIFRGDAERREARGAFELTEKMGFSLNIRVFQIFQVVSEVSQAHILTQICTYASFLPSKFRHKIQ